MGDLRVDTPRNGRRGAASHTDEIQAGNIHVPAADFDFASSNAKFDKAALTRPAREFDSDSESGSEDVKTNPSDSEGEKKREKERREEDREKEKEKEKTKARAKDTAYNPSKSFFDSLTPNSLSSRGGAQGYRSGGGRGRGRGYGRSRREEEAQRNMATFGETTPPSSHLTTGWGGRRGGPRRGGYTPQGMVPNGRPG